MRSALQLLSLRLSKLSVESPSHSLLVFQASYVTQSVGTVLSDSVVRPLVQQDSNLDFLWSHT